MIWKLPVDKRDALFAAIAQAQKLYVPAAAEKGEAQFAAWTPETKVSDGLNTLRSAKDFFFPQIQHMARFRREGKKIEVIDDRAESEDFVVWGVRACDARSFDVLDLVFLADPVDTYYQTRREHSTVVTAACSRPSETCFCTSFDIDPARPTGDARTWTVDGTIFIEPLNEKGEKLVALLKDMLTECGADDEAKIAAEQERVGQIMKRLPLANLRPDDNRERELEVFKSDKWKELSSHCLGCGACTFVCPTCQCFDIEDFQNGNTIERYRCWDSCMYHDFTLMAAGTPRKTQLERFRQRFMHKLVYYPKAHDGLYSCVGCGRCLRKCPIHMNIAKVMQALKEENAHE